MLFSLLIVVVVVVIVPTFMGTFLFIPKIIKPRWFSFFTLVFTNHFVCHGHSINTHNALFWPSVGGFNSTTFWLLVVGSIPLEPTTLSPRQTSLSFWVKANRPQQPCLSLSLPLINSLCLHSLACIRWLPLTFFPFLVKVFSQQSIFLKVVLARYQTTPSTPHWS